MYIVLITETKSSSHKQRKISISVARLTKQKIDHNEKVKLWTNVKPLWRFFRCYLSELEGRNLCTEAFPPSIFNFSPKKYCTTTLLLGNDEIKSDCIQVTTRKIEWYTGLYTNMGRGWKIFLYWFCHIVEKKFHIIFGCWHVQGVAKIS